MSSDHWKPCGLTVHGAEDTVYVVADQDADHRIDLGGDAWLLVKEKNDVWLDFAVFELRGRSLDRAVADQHTMLFHGGGPSGSLRECRHIWWGNDGDGYTFYLNFRVVEAALRELRRWFDGD